VAPRTGLDTEVRGKILLPPPGEMYPRNGEKDLWLNYKGVLVTNYICSSLGKKYRNC
jgi:hypothetical protein